MFRKLSLPVILILGMIFCGPGAGSSSRNEHQGCPVNIFQNVEDHFNSYRSGAVSVYKPAEFQRRSPNAVFGGPSRGPSRGDQRRRSWDRISTDTLLKFLKEHEKELAGRLEGIREENPRSFSEQVRALKALYGPVIEQMKEDPKAGKMSLEKIRLRLKIPDAVDNVKNVPEESRNQAKQKLTDLAVRLFDVIVSEEAYDIDQMEEWLNHPEDRRWLSRNEYRSHRNYIEQNREDIEEWQKNKEEIVEQRVIKLLQEHRDFPWGN